MTNAELVILCLIAEKPRHGYQIEQIIEARGMRDWTEVGFSSIYYLLKKLKEDGLIESRPEPAEGRGPARKVYHISRKGRKEWLQGSLETISAPKRAVSSFLLGLSVIPALPQAEVIAGLENYLNQLHKRYEHIQSRVEEQRPLPPHVEAMFEYSLAMVEAEQQWVDGFLKQVKANKFIYQKTKE